MARDEREADRPEALQESGSSAQGTWLYDVPWSDAELATALPDETIQLPREAPVADLIGLRPRRVRLAPEVSADFMLEDEIGRGGMGVVVTGRQMSLDREVAVKMLRPELSDSQRVRSLFLDEAAVTAGLEHPNIVPVYEVGETADGSLLSVMRWVRGVPWSDVIATRGERENLEILLKVCDAVAFAHSRGIVHRDLKPHNVMLGEYGEVVVVDWGLAVAVQRGARARRLEGGEASSGTAAYMAPEMARGEADVISFASDVYLLGGILFQVLTGERPHPGASVLECLSAAARNEIAQTEVTGELVQVARRAMAADPADRFASVQELQSAIRQAQSHADSELLARRAAEVLNGAADEAGYDGYARAVHGFEEALELWPENRAAREGALQARTRYARCALARQDLDLAASLIGPNEDSQRDLLRTIERARLQRDSRQRMVSRLKHVAAVLAVAVVVTVSVSMVTIVNARDRARVAERHAAEQRNLALGTLETLVNEVDAQLEGRPAMEPLRRVLLDHAIGGLQRVASAVDSAEELHEVDESLAAAHSSLARIFFSARMRDAAERHQRRAVEILRRLDAEQKVAPADTANAERLLADILHDYAMGDVGRSLEWYRAAIERVTEGEHGVEDLDATSLEVLASAYLGMVDALVDLERADEARAFAELAVDVRKRQLEAVGDESLVRSQTLEGLAEAQQRLGDTVLASGDTEMAEAVYADALSRAQQASTAAGHQPSALRLQGLLWFDLGHMAASADAYDAAAERLRRARTIQQALVESDPSNVNHRRDLLPTVLTLGDLERDARGESAALALYEDARAVAEEILELNPSSLEAQRDLFICHNRLGDLELQMGRAAEAIRAYERGAELSVRVARASPDNLLAQTDEVVSWYKLGEANLEHGDRQAALRAFRSARLRLQALADSGQIDESSRYWNWVAEVDRQIELLEEL